MWCILKYLNSSMFYSLGFIANEPPCTHKPFALWLRCVPVNRWGPPASPWSWAGCRRSVAVEVREGQFEPQPQGALTYLACHLELCPETRKTDSWRDERNYRQPTCTIPHTCEVPTDAWGGPHKTRGASRGGWPRLQAQRCRSSRTSCWHLPLTVEMAFDREISNRFRVDACF